MNTNTSLKRKDKAMLCLIAIAIYLGVSLLRWLTDAQEKWHAIAAKSRV